MNLARLRKEKKITQSHLAKCLHVSRSTVAMWETEMSQPSADSLLEIANILDVSVDEILGNISHQLHEDDDILQLREDLRRNPELRLLFSAAKDASKDDLIKTLKIIKTLKGEE